MLSGILESGSQARSADYIVMSLYGAHKEHDETSASAGLSGRQRVPTTLGALGGLQLDSTARPPGVITEKNLQQQRRDPGQVPGD